MSTDIETMPARAHHDAKIDEKANIEHIDQKTDAANFRADAMEAENVEHNMTVLQAVKAYPMACLWAFIMSSTIVRGFFIHRAYCSADMSQIMEAYCVFLMGNFIALPAFRTAYGIDDGKGGLVIATSWQSALQVGGPLGALIGVFLAGPLTSWIGYRWATITGLMGLNAAIFIMFFADSLGVFFASQLIEGIPWGIFVSRLHRQ
jgi:SP family general alpha glucoside:H+ symporter-like MFS transporter